MLCPEAETLTPAGAEAEGQSRPPSYPHNFLKTHNNACENAIRPVAVGRRNWLFAGSQRGGHAAATIYSLIESCRRVDVDPFVYLRDVLIRTCTHPASRVQELVPAAWKETLGTAVTG